MILQRTHRPSARRLRRIRRFFPLGGERLEERLALAYEPALLADINDLPVTFRISGSHIGTLAGIVYFGGVDNYSSGLWRSDGTTAGTWQVSPTSPDFGEFCQIGDELFFSGWDVLHGAELWKTDGTPEGTVLIKDIVPGKDESQPQNPTLVNGTLFFSANDGVHGRELWKSDGTASGTVLVKDINPDAASSWPYRFTNVNGKLFFSADAPGTGRELWMSDGTELGTVLVKDIRPGISSSFSDSNIEGRINDNGVLFFSANDGVHGYELWKSDGTPEGTSLVKDIFAGPGSSLTSTQFTTIGGTVFFTAFQSANGKQIWQTDGTEAGTHRIGGPTFSSIGSNAAFIQRQDEVVFGAQVTQTNGYRLWKSSGGPDDATPFGPEFSSILLLANVNGAIFFLANSMELWKSDGTDAGTSLVKTVYDAESRSDVSLATAIGDKLFFAAKNTALDIELWFSDGTNSGTGPVIRRSGSGSAFSFSPPPMVPMGQVLYFVAPNSNLGAELWRTDGTAAGTYILKDIFPGAGDAAPGLPANIDGGLFFTANDGVHGRELWTSDGTLNGTRMVGDIISGSSSLFAANLTNVNGTLFFTGRGSVSGLALWKSDGTVEGTIRIKDFGGLPNQSLPGGFANFNGTLYFRVGNFANGVELWKSDGTTEGTVMVKDIAPGAASSTPSGITAVNNQFYFVADDGQHGSELWKSDGTAEGTMLVKDINPGAGSGLPADFTVANGRVFFTAIDSSGIRQIWSTDGTANGTQPLLATPPPGFGVIELVNVSGTLFFCATTDASGNELWRTDGTTGGTVLVKDIWPGSESSLPGSLSNVHGVLLFSAIDQTGQPGMWRSDGTEAGTWEVYKSSIPFSPRGMTAVGDRVVFLDDDGVHGRELFTLRYFNAAPSFVGGGDVAARDDDGPRSITGWASEIAAGTPDEAGQKLNFEVVAEQPELFLQPPSLNAAGALTFTPRPNVRGVATIRVTLHDDGGTASGGVDASSQMFKIQIDKPQVWHNADLPLDVNPDGAIVAGDALEIINYINAFGSGKVPAASTIGPLYYDATGDDFVAPNDALAVINHINAFGAGAGEGEMGPDARSDPDSDWLSLLVMDVASQAKRHSRMAV